jgi:tRNA 2-selenouridine synthase
MGRIRRRLGGDRYQRVTQLLDDALARHTHQGDTEPHREWIAVLLRDYYDGMYEYQLGKKQGRIVFSGEHEALAEFLQQEYGIGQRVDER